MAEIEMANEDTILRALQNAGVAMYGPTFNVQQYSGLKADQLRDFALPSFRTHLQSGTSLQQQASPERFNANGTKLVRDDIVARKADILGGQASVADVQSYESMAFLFGGYQMNIDGQLDDQERAHMDEFLTNLGNDIDLSSTFQDNVQVREVARAEAEARAAADAEAAAEQTARTSEIASGLVYSNFLKPEDMNNTNAIASAFNNMLAEHRDDPGVNIYDLQTKAFVDPNNGNWNISEEAAEIFRDLNKNAVVSPQFRSDLESNSVSRISNAQSYINLQGGDVEVSGTIDTATVQAAQTIMDKDISIEGLPHSAINSMAAQGQLALPDDAAVQGILSENEYGYYQSLFNEADRAQGTFGQSREQFLANTLIQHYPAEYEEYLDTVNASGIAPLDVTVELATVDTDFLPATPEGQTVAAAYTQVSLDPESAPIDVSAVINNPFGVEAIDTTIIGGKSYLNDTLDNDAIAQTPEGQMVFSEQYLVTDKVAEAILSSTAIVDGKITMGDALGVYHNIAQTDQEAFYAGAMIGGNDRPSMQEGDYVATQLGYERGHGFDLANPTELASVMTGVLAYANQYDIPGDGHYINNLLAQQAAGDRTIIALGEDIQMVADVRTGVVDALPQGTQFATAHGIIDAVIEEVSPETIQVAEPAATEPLPQSRMVLEDAEVAKLYNDEPEISPSEILMDQIRSAAPALGSILPTPAMLTSNPAIQTTISLRDQFGASASPITSTPPAGLDVDGPANINTINPELLATGTDGLTLPNFSNKEPEVRQSQMNPNLNLGF